MLVATLILSAFFLGSLPFGLLIGRVRGVDIREHGSRNIGATNVGRVLGRPLGVLCFALDFAKGFVPTILAGWMLGTLGRLDAPAAAAWQWLAVMAAPIVGHMFSPWVGFKGGKGVATGFGALVAVWPALTVPALFALLVWSAALAATRFMGLSSCLAAASLPVSVTLCLPIARAVGMSVPADQLGSSGLWPMWPYLITAAGLGAMVIWRHRGNIKRMIAGTEPRIGSAKPAPPAST